MSNHSNRTFNDLLQDGEEKTNYRDKPQQTTTTVLTSSSCWETESPTPMTSRPHFKVLHRQSQQHPQPYELLELPYEDHKSHSPHRGRGRSQSLGSDYLQTTKEDSETGTLVWATADLSSSSSSLPKRRRTTATASPAHQQQQHRDWKDLWLQTSFQQQQQSQCLALPPLHPKTTAGGGGGGPTLYYQNHEASSHNSLPPDEAEEEDCDDKSPLKVSMCVEKGDDASQRSSSDVPTITPTMITTTTPPQSSPTSWISHILYGLINATIILPVLMSFSSIIYRDQAFAPYFSHLVQLVSVSGMVHQLCFSTFSSLPFAVGQVQDAGLIFLSAMASYIVQYCEERGYGDDVMLATVTVCLSLATALLGVGLLIIGQAGLAECIQFLPTCVIGGYLAFIGWFCGMAGIGLMAHASSVSFTVLANGWNLILPGVLGGLTIYSISKWLRHIAVLPCFMILMLFLFYIVLFWTGTTLEEVTQQGWMIGGEKDENGVITSQPLPSWKETWQFFRFDKVAWSVLPQLLWTELSMIVVVAMSSSLDVAAIELEMKRPLNYNGELKMVGLSNLVSGLTGGYTGSYIFSQSIFSLRNGIRSPLAGYVLATAQALFFLLDVPVVAYVPSFFFGSLLSMICMDLLYEWLWDVRQKVTPVEYLICWLTFLCIHFTGVEMGIALGVVLHAVSQKIGLHVGQPQSQQQHQAPDAVAGEEKLTTTKQDGAAAGPASLEERTTTTWASTGVNSSPYTENSLLLAFFHPS